MTEYEELRERFRDKSNVMAGVMVLMSYPIEDEKGQLITNTMIDYAGPPGQKLNMIGAAAEVLTRMTAQHSAEGFEQVLDMIQLGAMNARYVGGDNAEKPEADRDEPV